MLGKLYNFMWIVAALAYTLAVGAVAQFFIFPHIHGVWVGTATQVGLYALLALPFVIIKPNLLRLYKGTAWQLRFGLFLIALSVIYGYIVNHDSVVPLFNNFVRQLATGPVEELVFRGFIWHKSLAVSKNSLTIIAINVMGFTAIHIPYVIAQHINPLTYLAIGGVGLALCIVRLKTKNLLLGSLLHIAVNLSS